MKFYSGFSLKNDALFFEEYINDSDYCVCGFSYGSIKALSDVKKRLKMGQRVDFLQLFSPAFFQTKSSKFKKLQMSAYEKNEDKYLRSFIASCFLPYESKNVERAESSLEELEELLSYEWIKSDFLELQRKGVKIEVYLGSEDKIIDVARAREFFVDASTLTYIKNANHFLQKN